MSQRATTELLKKFPHIFVLGGEPSARFAMMPYISVPEDYDHKGMVEVFGWLEEKLGEAGKRWDHTPIRARWSDDKHMYCYSSWVRVGFKDINDLLMFKIRWG